MTNMCVYDCAYCVNRKSNENIRRTAFTPRELADLTIGFTDVTTSKACFSAQASQAAPDHTTELMIRTLSILARRT